MESDVRYVILVEERDRLKVFYEEELVRFKDESCIFF